MSKLLLYKRRAGSPWDLVCPQRRTGSPWDLVCPQRRAGSPWDLVCPCVGLGAHVLDWESMCEKDWESLGLGVPIRLC